jgi:hypothetical protein
MGKVINVKLDSTRNIRIDASNLSESERRVAIGALRDAELLVDAFAWVAKKIEQFGARLFLKPSLKH